MKKMSLTNAKKLSKMEMKGIVAGFFGCTGYCLKGGCVLFGGTCTCSSNGTFC